MINNENLEKLYNEIINNGEIATKKLSEFKFYPVDISTLQKNNIIIRTRWGHYTINDINTLYTYGLKLLNDRNFGDAFKCFERCYELDPNHKEACLQLLLRSIRSKDYTKSIEYYETLANSHDELQEKNADFYLYLLSFLTELPTNHKEYAKYISLDQISLTDKSTDNNIRDMVLQKKFTLALKEIKNLSTNNSVHKYIVLSLLNDICELEANLKQTILSSCMDKNYEKIIECLENKRNKQKLTVNEEYILKLTYDLIELKETKTIPKLDSSITGNLYIAIDHNNYNVALILSNDYNKRNNIINSENPINILLNDICILIRNIKKGIVTNKVASNSSNVTNEQKSNNEETLNSTNEDTNKIVDEPITTNNIIYNLIKNDLDKAFDTLINFLNKNNAIKYQFLIINLIKISILENDLVFTKPMNTLKELENGTFKYDLGSYIKEFYTNLANRKLEVASIYLDIINTANEINNKCILTSGMMHILASTAKALNYKYNNKSLEKIDTIVNNKIKKHTI